MKTLLLVAAGLIGLVLLVIVICVLIGYRLPVTHVATRSIHVPQRADSVYALIRDFESYPAWRSGVTNVEILGDADGHLQYREKSKQGTITYDLIEDAPPQRMVSRIADRNLGYGGSWTYTLAETADGTTLTITENGEVTNPFFRFMSRYVFGHTATIERYLADVVAHMK
jgi:hypothetical protein